MRERAGKGAGASYATALRSSRILHNRRFVRQPRLHPSSNSGRKPLQQPGGFLLIRELLEALDNTLHAFV